MGREPGERFSRFPLCADTASGGPSANPVSPDTESAGNLSLRLLASSTVRNKALLYKPPSPWWCVTAAQAHPDSMHNKCTSAWGEQLILNSCRRNKFAVDKAVCLEIRSSVRAQAWHWTQEALCAPGNVEGSGSWEESCGDWVGGRRPSLACEYEKSSRYWGMERKEQGSFDSLHLGAD